MLLAPQPGRGGGCEATSPSVIGTRPEVAFSGRGGSGSRRASGCGAGAAGPAPQRVVPGSQPTQCHTLGLARGSRPFDPPTRGSFSLAPITPAAPLSHDGCQWALKIAGFWAPKVAGSERCPARCRWLPRQKAGMPAGALIERRLGLRGLRSESGENLQPQDILVWCSRI